MRDMWRPWSVYEAWEATMPQTQVHQVTISILTAQMIARDYITRHRKWRSAVGCSLHGEEGERSAAVAALDPDSTTLERLVEVGGKRFTPYERCSECRSDEPPFVVFDSMPDDYDSDRTQVCANCLRKAIALVSP